MIATVAALADRVIWAIDIIGAPSAMLLALLTQAEHSVRYASGRVVASMSAGYTGEGKTDAKDAYMIAETVRIRRDLTVIDPSTDLVRNLGLLIGHRADLIADRVRIINRLRDVMTSVFPSLEREFDCSSCKGALVLLTGYASPNSCDISANHGWPNGYEGDQCATTPRSPHELSPRRGTRMSTTVSVGEVERLARNMTWKWAGVDLFYGGAKAGIWADPNTESKEVVLRAFVRALKNEVPEEYVFGLDVGLTEKDAAIMLDEVGGRGGAVGTSHALGGLPCDQLGVTGHGVAESADAAAAAIGLSTSSLSVSIQGFGAVCAATAKRLAELGATVVAVSTSQGGIHNPDGLDADQPLNAA